jgi:hypothetical protein
MIYSYPQGDNPSSGIDDASGIMVCYLLYKRLLETDSSVAYSSPVA